MVFEQPLSDHRPTRAELLLSCVLIAVLTAAIYSPHVVRGGWYSDDWLLIAHGRGRNLIELLELAASPLFRPLQTLTLALLHLIATDHSTLYLSIATFLTALQSWLFYLVLRAMRLRPAIAGLTAALFVVLPCIDALRLWSIAIALQIAGSLYLIGVLAALRGLTRASGKRAVAWHAGAAVLYAASIATYEATVGLILATPLLYALLGSRRAAVRRLAADYLAVALVLGISAPLGTEERGATISLEFAWERAGQLLSNGLTVFRSLLPWSDVLGSGPGLILLSAGVVGAGMAIRAGGKDGRALAAWTKITLVGIAFALGGLLMFLVADPYYVPRLTGLGNRTGAFAAFGAVTALVALIAIAVGGLGSLLSRSRIGFALALVLTLVTGVNLAARELRQQDAWADSWAEQKRILASFEPIVRSDLARHPTTASIVTFGHTTGLPEGVPVFESSWDLRGALMATYGLTDIAVRPWTWGVRCGRRGVVAPDANGDLTELYEYRRLLFIDVSLGSVEPVRDQRTCSSMVNY